VIVCSGAKPRNKKKELSLTFRIIAYDFHGSTCFFEFGRLQSLSSCEARLANLDFLFSSKSISFPRKRRCTLDAYYRQLIVISALRQLAGSSFVLVEIRLIYSGVF